MSETLNTIYVDPEAKAKAEEIQVLEAGYRLPSYKKLGIDNKEVQDQAELAVHDTENRIITEALAELVDANATRTIWTIDDDGQTMTGVFVLTDERNSGIDVKVSIKRSVETGKVIRYVLSKYDGSKQDYALIMNTDIETNETKIDYRSTKGSFIPDNQMRPPVDEVEARDAKIDMFKRIYRAGAVQKARNKRDALAVDYVAVYLLQNDPVTSDNDRYDRLTSIHATIPELVAEPVKPKMPVVHDFQPTRHR